jgi:hypothetical protein
LGDSSVSEATADPRLSQALADLHSYFEELSIVLAALTTPPVTIGGVIDNLDRAERKAREIADKYAEVRALFLDQHIR